MKSRFVAAVILAVLAGSSSLALAAGAGSLKAKFVYDGKAPAAKPLTIGADKAYCGKPEFAKALVDESLVVGAKGELANVLIYMSPARGQKVAIHPNYEAKKKEKVILDNHGCRFEPHVALLWTEQIIELGNKDTVGHNTKIDGISGKSINPLLPPGAKLDEKFAVAERLPLIVGCNIHPWMRARLLIQDHPYFAKSGADGTLEIKDIPPGEYEFRVYHEAAGYVTGGKVGGKSVAWKAGKFTAKIEDGKVHDLGEVKVDPALFKAG
jgi:hypothetical protein